MLEIYNVVIEDDDDGIVICHGIVRTKEVDRAKIAELVVREHGYDPEDYKVFSWTVHKALHPEQEGMLDFDDGETGDFWMDDPEE